jgi:hypothetical protein
MALAGDHVQILVGGAELTGDVNQVIIDDQRDSYDVSAFGDPVHNFVLGKRNISVEHNGYVNPATGKSHLTLRAVDVQRVVSILLGQNIAPVTGDPTYSMNFQQGNYSVMPEVNKYVPFKAKFANAGSNGGWGVALTPPTSMTNTTNGSSVDNGASTTKGAVAFLHVLQATTTDTYQFIIEHSTTGAFGGEQTTLFTFSADGRTLVGQVLSVTGTINRYVRYKATRLTGTGETLRIAVSLVRL